MQGVLIINITLANLKEAVHLKVNIEEVEGVDIIIRDQRTSKWVHLSPRKEMKSTMGV